MKSGANVRPCSKPSWPASQALYDLTRDLNAAEEILKEIQPFFKFKVGEARFSGFARRKRPDQTTLGDPHFYVQIWNADKLYRTVAFKHLAYHGILHVNLLNPARAERIKDDDPVSMICSGLESWTNIEPNFQSGQIWYADRNNLEISVPWRKLKATKPRTTLDGKA